VKPVLKYTVDDDRNLLTIDTIDSFVFISYGGKKYLPSQVTQLILNNFSKPPSQSSSKGGMYPLIVILKYGVNVVSALEATAVEKHIINPQKTDRMKATNNDQLFRVTNSLQTKWGTIYAGTNDVSWRSWASYIVSKPEANYHIHKYAYCGIKCSSGYVVLLRCSSGSKVVIIHVFFRYISINIILIKSLPRDHYQTCTNKQVSREEGGCKPNHQWKIERFINSLSHLKHFLPHLMSHTDTLIHVYTFSF
jgi:hypothetical protein